MNPSIKPRMLSMEELTTYIHNTPIEHILQTRYDILNITDPRFSPFIHNRSTIFNGVSTECHSEAYTTFVLNIIKYYCSDTFCYMIYKYIYKFLYTGLESTPQLYDINAISIIHLFRIISIYSINVRIIDLHKTNLNSSLYIPFDINFNIGESITLSNLYIKLVDTLSIGASYSLTIHTFNKIIDQYIKNTKEYIKPIILKASLNTGKTNLHSFTMTIMDNIHIIISGANGAAKCLCSVTQDNKITVVMFQQYLQVIEDIKNSIILGNADMELINTYTELYNEIFLKNVIIRSVYDETGLTIDQYLMIIIGIYNYIVEMYTHKNISTTTKYITYLQSLQYITQYFQIYHSEINTYKHELCTIILKIPKIITQIENHITNIRSTFSEKDDSIDENEETLIFKFILKLYKSTNLFNNTYMHDVILDIIANILEEEGIPEYLLIDQIDVKYNINQYTEIHTQFKFEQLNQITNITDINVRLFGITDSNIHDFTTLNICYNIMNSSNNHNIFKMYTNIGNLFINKQPLIKSGIKEMLEDDYIALMSAPIVLIDILDRYCKPSSDGGYKEHIETYLDNYLKQNINITYEKFNVYNILQKTLH